MKNLVLVRHEQGLDDPYTYLAAEFIADLARERPIVFTEMPPGSVEAAKLRGFAKESFDGRNSEGDPLLVAFDNQRIIWACARPSPAQLMKELLPLLRS